MSGHLIPNSFVRWHFEALNYDAKLSRTVREKLDIPEAIFTSDGYYLTANQFANVISETTIASDDESFGALPSKMGRGSFHMMAHACISCSTLEKTIQRAFIFYQLMQPQLHWQLIIDGEQCHLDFGELPGNNRQSEYFITFMSCVFWRFISWMIDKPLPLHSVQFTYPKPDDVSEMHLLFKIAPEFSASFNRVTFASELLSSPVKQTPKSLSSFLLHVPECLLSHYKEEISLGKQVREYLEQQNDFNGMTVQHLAEHFNCSEQSFIRHLRAEGLKYSQIREQVRKQRAHHLMLTSNLSNQEISQQLGFADPGVFYRNFKKWFGQTPNQFKASL